MKVTIKKWQAVSYWHWDIPNQDDLCGICRVSFDGTCPSCSYPGDGCPLVVGECHHNFHMHCIMKWLETDSSKGLCPMCRQPFKMSYPAGNEGANQPVSALSVGQAPTNSGSPNNDDNNQVILQEPWNAEITG